MTLRALPLLLGAIALPGCYAGSVGIALGIIEATKPGGTQTVVPLNVKELSAESPTTPDRVQVAFLLDGGTGGRLSARVEYRVVEWFDAEGDGELLRGSATPLPGAEPPSELSRGARVRFVWNAGLDLRDRSARLELTVTPSEEGVEGEARSLLLRAGNTPPYLRVGTTIELANRADFISASFDLVDAESDRVNLKALLIRVDEELYDVPLTVFKNLRRDFPSKPGEGEGVSFSFSVKDLDRADLPEALRAIAQPGFVAERFRLRLRLQDWEGESEVTAEGEFRFDNNDAPVLTLLPVLPEDTKSGIIPVRYTLRDAQSSPATLDVFLEFPDDRSRVVGNEYPSSASDGRRSLPTGDEKHVFTFLWDAISQMRGDENVRIVLRASDSEPGTEVSQDLSLAFPLLTRGPEIPVGRGPRALLAADFDQDGFTDAAIANTSADSVSLLYGSVAGLSFVDKVVVGVGPTAVTGGDFNGDGATDLFVVRSERGNPIDIGVYIPGGTGGTGGFRVDRMVSFNVGNDPIAATTGRFNRDTFLDVAVVAETSGEVLEFHGGPEGLVFLRSVALGGSPKGVRCTDLVGDDFDDVIVAVPTKDQIAIVQGSAGGLQPAPTVTAVSGRPTLVIEGRFRGRAAQDAPMDLLVACAAPARLVLLRNEAGGLKEVQDVLLGAGIPSAIAVEDFDGDGWLDAVVALKGENGIAVFRGSSAGLVPSQGFSVGSAPGSVATGDADADGFPDLIVANEASGNVSQFRATASGLEPLGEINVGTEPVALASGDFDGDSVSDWLAVNKSTNSVTPFRGRSDVQWRVEDEIPVGSAPVAVVGLDFNRDGYLDAAVANFGSSNVSVLKGRPGGIDPLGEVKTLEGPALLAPGDFDADGYDDVAVGLVISDRGVWDLAGGPEGLRVRNMLFVGQNASIGKQPVALATAELNQLPGDDLVVPIRAGWVASLIGTREGLSILGRDTSVGGTGRDDTFVAVTAADFNGDGYADAAVPEKQLPNVYVFRGPPTAAPRVPDVLDLRLRSDPRAIHAEDFNGDRILDLVVVNGAHDTVSYFKGKDPGAFEPSVESATGDEPFRIQAGDYDGDSFMDLVVANRRPSPLRHTLTFLRGTATGLARVRDEPMAGPVLAVRSGDFSNDGLADIVVLLSEPNRLALLTGDPTGFLRRRLVHPLPHAVRAASGDYERLAIGDFDRDGFLDVLKFNEVAGSVTLSRQRTFFPHTNLWVNAEDVEKTSVTLLDSRAPARFRLGLPPQSLVASSQVCLVPSQGFALPAPAATAGGARGVLTDAVTLLRSSQVLAVAATLTLRVREDRAVLLRQDPDSSLQLKVIHRGHESTVGEEISIPNEKFQIEEFSGGTGVSFPIREFGSYVVVFERSVP